MSEEKKYENVPVAGFTKASLLKKSGEVLTGTYEGYHQGGKFNSITHYLILEAGGVQMKSQDEFTKAKDGDKIGISGAKKLNEALQGVARGSKIEISFDGFKEFQTKKGETAREALFAVKVLETPKQETAVETEGNETVPNVFARS